MMSINEEKHGLFGVVDDEAILVLPGQQAHQLLLIVNVVKLKPSLQTTTTCQLFSDYTHLSSIRVSVISHFL